MKRNGNIVRYTAEEIEERIASGAARIDHKRLDAMTDEEIEANVNEDEEGDIDFSIAYLGMPGPEAHVYVRYDPDVLAWFLAKPESSRLMNQALRDYIKRHDPIAGAAD